MKTGNIALYAMILVAVLLTSCSVIGGIFKAGIWTGIIFVVILVGLFAWIFTKR